MLVRRVSFEGLCHARDLLSEIGEERPTIREVAREAGVSPFHFIRQFEAVFGLTPDQFRIQARLEEAKRLLARDRLSVTEVCMALGFSSLGSFSASFRRRVGESPSEYRRRIRPQVRVPGELPPLMTVGCLSLMAHLPVGAFRNPGEA
jgi:AraC-like DNA-binding protein